MDNTGVWCLAKPNGRTSEVPNTLPAEEAYTFLPHGLQMLVERFQETGNTSPHQSNRNPSRSGGEGSAAGDAIPV